MNKADFLNELYAYLSPLPKKERLEIISDFREHFREGAADSKSEEQICRELGSPLECAAQYVGEEVFENFRKGRAKRKKLWTAAFVFNLIQAVISLPVTVALFAAALFMGVMFAFVIPAVSSAAFTVFGVSSTLAVLFLGIVTLLLSIDGIRDCIKNINK